MSLRDLLSPFYVWQRAFEKPYTSIKPIQERPGAAAYRGFHINVSEECIGCGSCHTICMNGAIDLVRVEEFEGRKRRQRAAPAFRLRPLLLVRPVRGHLHRRLPAHEQRVHLDHQRPDRLSLHRGC